MPGSPVHGILQAKILEWIANGLFQAVFLTQAFRMDWLDLLAVKGLSRVFSNTTVQKHQFFCAQLSLAQLSHPYMTTGKTIALTRWTFVADSPVRS